MIARGFRPVAWVAAVGVAALSCYMLSLQVASERAELASIERRIVATRQDIRQLQTELGTRGRLQQLEAWNAEVLALSAPTAGQFLDNGVTLARFDTREQGIDARAAEVRMASAQLPPPAAPAPRPAALVQAVAAEDAPSLEPARPRVRQASLTVAPEPAAPPPRPAAAPAPARPGALLDEATLRDLNAAARAERGGARN
ncbi:MAG: hypothetical protein KF780_14055 [Sphingomonas sp.]|nr:hypothetical protein [Sphingomonas sp.]